MAWTKEQWAAYRRSKGSPERDPLTHPRFMEAGRELALMEQLPFCQWPEHLRHEALQLRKKVDGRLRELLVQETKT